MKKSEAERLLKKLGAKFLRHGTNHDVWINPDSGAEARLPRHATQETATGTWQKILKQLGYK